MGDAVLWRISYALDAPPRVGAFVVRARATGSDSAGIPLDSCTVDAFMPAHTHDVANVVRTSIEDGACVARGASFQMPGTWVVRIDLRSGDRSDGASFTFVVP